MPSPDGRLHARPVGRLYPKGASPDGSNPVCRPSPPAALPSTGSASSSSRWPAPSLRELTVAECQGKVAQRLADGILLNPAVIVRLAELRPLYVIGGCAPYREPLRSAMGTRYVPPWILPVGVARFKQLPIRPAAYLHWR